ncbi:DNA-binding protein [Sphingobium sp. SCG-1]|uniref:helix-turn-helix transcriptional regulator n=1 Tax=Sphingobium sp. SCG-1 TaxID=2072936 RepID=UPI000CD68646|nr:DNA-binding protein [Sphingobium sp. SCG-1]AUW58297.1 DNA-binding protein [Sphingobium sp. SCG-1]
MSEMTFDQLCELFAYVPQRRPLDTKETAALLGVHFNTLEQYRFRGEGPRFFSPPGTRRVWYAELDVLRWLASGAKQSTSEQAAA